MNKSKPFKSRLRIHVCLLLLSVSAWMGSLNKVYALSDSEQLEALGAYNCGDPSSIFYQLSRCSTPETHFNRTLLATLGEDPFPKLHMDGASNTKGIGASLPFEHILKWHLAHEPEPFQNQLIDTRLWISLDYFFPTNFREFYQTHNLDDLEAATEQKIAELIKTLMTTWSWQNYQARRTYLKAFLLRQKSCPCSILKS